MSTESNLREYLEKAVFELHQYRQRLNEAERKDSEPIAIV